MTIDQVVFNKAKRVINLPAREQSVVALSECFLTFLGHSICYTSLDTSVIKMFKCFHFSQTIVIV